MSERELRELREAMINERKETPENTEREELLASIKMSPDGFTGVISGELITKAIQAFILIEEMEDLLKDTLPENPADILTQFPDEDDRHASLFQGIYVKDLLIEAKESVGSVMFANNALTMESLKETCEEEGMSLSELVSKSIMMQMFKRMGIDL